MSIFFKDLFLLGLYNCLPLHMYVYHMHDWCLQRAEEGVRAPWIRVVYSYVFVLEQSAGPLQEQPMFLSGEPSIQTHNSISRLTKKFPSFLIAHLNKNCFKKTFLQSYHISPTWLNLSLNIKLSKVAIHLTQVYYFYIEAFMVTNMIFFTFPVFLPWWKMLPNCPD